MTVQVIDAKESPADREWVKNIYPFYLHDLSEFDDGYYRLNERGLWEPDHLPHWFADETHHPLVMRESGRRIGFAFVGQSPFPHMTAGLDFQLAEFFVLRALRRTGLGRRGAFALFDRFPGTWEVTQMARNLPAVKFWRRVIGEYTGGRYEEASLDGSPRQVFSTARHVT